MYCRVIALMMEATRTSETSIDNYFTRQFIPEDRQMRTFPFTSIQIHDHSKFLVASITLSVPVRTLYQDEEQ
jgi:hypothetical protein